MGGSLFLMIGSTALGHLVVLATLPLIGRLYLPGDLGQLGAFLSFLGVASIATSLRYDIMIVGSASELEGAALVMGVSWLSLPLSLLWSGVFAWLIHVRMLGFEILPLEAALWMFPALVTTQLFFTLRYWLMRGSQFAVIARVTVWQNVVRGVAPVAFYPLGGGWAGLVAAEVFGRFTGLGAMLRARGVALRKAFTRLQRGDIRRAFAAYPESPGAGFPSALINATSNMLPLPLLAGLFGAAAAGYFSLVQRALQLPIGLVSRNVADVFHARLADHARNAPSSAAGLFWRTAALLLVVGGVPSLFVAAFGRPLLVLVMGPKWSPAADLLVAMIPWSLAMFVVSPLSRVVVVYRGQVSKLLYDGISLAGVIVVLQMGAREHWSLARTVWVLSWSQAGTYVVYFIVLVRLLSRVPVYFGRAPDTVGDE